MSQPAPHNYLPIRKEWLKLHQEEILEPELPVVDAHHHFCDRPGWQYHCPDFAEDANTGHAVRASVYMQALTRYRTSGTATRVYRLDRAAPLTANIKETS